VPGTYGKQAKLTERSLDKLISDDYSHKTTVIEVPENKEDVAHEKLIDAVIAPKKGR
jgi:hypothetical protein